MKVRYTNLGTSGFILKEASNLSHGAKELDKEQCKKLQALIEKQKPQFQKIAQKQKELCNEFHELWNLFGEQK